MRSSTKRRLSTTLSALAVAGLLITAGVFSRAAAAPAHTAPLNPAPLSAGEAPAEGNGGSIVEDGAYPDAAAIEAGRHVKLISGNGHLVLADCATPPVGNVGLLKVWTTELHSADDIGLICFKVLAADGLLNLWVPAVYEIDGDGRVAGAGHKVTAKVVTDAGVQATVEVSPSGSTQVGVGKSGDPTTLLQLKGTP